MKTGSKKHSPVSRRRFLGWATAACTVGSVRIAVAAAVSEPDRTRLITIEQFSAQGLSDGTVEVPKIAKSNAEWRKQLSAAAFQVTRLNGTERPFSGPLNENHDAGLYRCICCETALFDSETKFESGTGWPSFWRPISKLNVVEHSDLSLGMSRTAVSCKRCDAHLGHVFRDGPRPTGLRYCMNSVSLHFVARA